MEIVEDEQTRFVEVGKHLHERTTDRTRFRFETNT
jgi:hypothetical protein